MNEHDRLVDRAAREARTVLFVGGLDAGKSTLARATAAFALGALGAILGTQDVDAWIIALVVSAVSVLLAGVLWSSRTL